MLAEMPSERLASEQGTETTPPASVPAWLGRLRGSSLLALAASLSGGLVVARSAFSAPFLGDDYVENLVGTSPGEWFGHTRFLRPLFYASLGFDHALFGAVPFGSHVFSVALHIATAVLAMPVAISLGRVVDAPAQWSRRVGWIAAIAFAISPTHGEAIHWVSARSDVLMTMFGLLAVWSFASYLAPSQQGATRRRAMLIASLASTLLALASKETAVAVPIVLFAVAMARPTEAAPVSRVRAAALVIAPHIALTVGWWIVRTSILGAVIGGYGTSPLTEVSPQRAVAQFGVMTGRAFLPPMPAAAWIAAAVAIAFGLVALIAAAARTNRSMTPELDSSVRFAACAAFSLVASVVPVVFIGTAATSPSGDRNVYLASAFAAQLVGAAFVALSSRRMLQIAVIATAVALTAMSSINESRRWHDSSRLAAAIVDSLGARDLSTTAYVVNLPADVRGAVCLHNAPAGLGPIDETTGAGLVFAITESAPAGADLVPAVTVDRRTRTVVTRWPDGSRASQPSEMGPWSVDIEGQRTSVTFEQLEGAQVLVVVGDRVVDIDSLPRAAR